MDLLKSNNSRKIGVRITGEDNGCCGEACPSDPR